MRAARLARACLRHDAAVLVTGVALLALSLIGCAAGGGGASDGGAPGCGQDTSADALARAHAAPARPPSPSAAPGLPGWRALGDALWSADGRTIEGRVGGGAQSFLLSEGEFGDFELDVDVRNLAPGNSGIQVRSHQAEDGRLFGYQIEIDPSERAWSGGLYDEARRGWLDDLADQPEARAAFRPGEWNHYRIVCDGVHIRSWVNGVPAADHLDPLDLSGHLALQVHGGNDTHVQWLDLTLVDRGARRWVAVPVTARPAPGEWAQLDEVPDGGAWRLRARGAGVLHLAVAREAVELTAPVPTTTTEAALWATRVAVFARVPVDEAVHDVAIALVDGRVACHVDGALAASWRYDPPVARRARLVVALEGATVVDALERLSDPATRGLAAAR